MPLETHAAHVLSKWPQTCTQHSIIYKKKCIYLIFQQKYLHYIQISKYILPLRFFFSFFFLFFFHLHSNLHRHIYSIQHSLPCFNTASTSCRVLIQETHISYKLKNIIFITCFESGFFFKGIKLEKIKYFKYLNSNISDQCSKPEIVNIFSQTIAALSKLQVFWKEKNIFSEIQNQTHENS